MAKYLSPKIIILGIDNLEPGSTDGYMYNRGKIGICVEGGYHKDPKAIDVAIESIYWFLSYFDMVDYSIKKAKKKIYKMNRIYFTKTNFIPNKKYGDFTSIKKGSVVGYDGKKAIRINKNCITLFVIKRKEPNKEAFLLGDIIK